MAVSFQVLNGGFPGHGTFEEKWKLERVIDKLELDLVIVAVYAANNLVGSWGNGPDRPLSSVHG